MANNYNDVTASDQYTNRAQYASGLPKARKRTYYAALTNTLKTVQLKDAKNHNIPVLDSTLVLRDFSDGGGLFQGSFGDFPNRYYQTACADATHPGYLIAALTSAPFNKALTGDLVGFHGVNAFSTMLFGAGAANDICLFKETSTTDATPVAITGAGTAGRPAASITGLYPIFIGGATTAQQVLECLQGAKPLLVTDAAGTLNAGVLDAAWNPTWWAYNTSLPGNPLIFQAGNSIFNSGTAASTVNFVPTATLPATIKAGGYGIGEHELANAPRRLYFVEPKENNTTGMLKFGAETLGYVRSVDLLGLDYQGLDFVNFPNGIKSAMFCVGPNGGGIIATDGKRVAFHDGANDTNLALFEQLVGSATDSTRLGQVNSAISLDCRGFEIKGGDAFALVDFFDGVTTTSGRFRYDWANGTWNRISGNLNGTNGTAQTIRHGSNGNPVSFNTGFSQYLFSANGTFKLTNQFLTTADENPYVLYRRTIGAGSSTGLQVAGLSVNSSLAGLLTPIWTFEGLEGMPSVVSEIELWGDAWAANAAGDGVYVAVYGAEPAYVSTIGDLERSLTTANGVNHTFLSQESPAGKARTYNKFHENKSFFYHFQAQIGPILTGGVRYNVNCLPVVIHFYTFTDGIVRDPDTVRGMQAAGG